MEQLIEKEQKARERVCLALDISDVKKALNYVDELRDYVGIYKVGKELHMAAGNAGINIIDEIYKKGANIFLDLKFHDTPNTVYGASKEGAVSGVIFFNVHVEGGEEMCKKALQGAYDGAKARGLIAPKVIGVTRLTSLSDLDLEAQQLGIDYDTSVRINTLLAKKWGLDGIVCPANKAGALETEFGSWLYVTPGIEWAGLKGAGQKQLYTPDMAVRDCSSSILVVGSAITKAEDRRAVAYEILQAMAKYVK